VRGKAEADRSASFQVLAILLEHPRGGGDPRKNCRNACGRITFVDVDHNLNTAVNTIRAGLEWTYIQPPRVLALIETLPRRELSSYIAPVQTNGPDAQLQITPLSARIDAPARSASRSRSKSLAYLAVLRRHWRFWPIAVFFGIKKFAGLHVGPGQRALTPPHF
jgi:hypothetical protein